MDNNEYMHSAAAPRITRESMSKLNELKSRKDP